MCLSLQNLAMFLSLMVRVVPNIDSSLALEDIEHPDFSHAAQILSLKLPLYEHMADEAL